MKAAFPSQLLHQPVDERIKYFVEDCVVLHSHFQTAYEEVERAIFAADSDNAIFGYGPSGAGKSCLGRELEKGLNARFSEDLQKDLGRIAVVRVEAPKPLPNGFDYLLLDRAILEAMNEPLIAYKFPCSREDWQRMHKSPFPPSRALGRDYAYAVEQALRFRKVAVVIVDEAHHLTIAKSSKTLESGFEGLKSRINRTQVLHIFLGTYDLLQFRNLSSQLGMRSVDVHLGRYRADSVEEKKAFLSAVETLVPYLPLRNAPDLTPYLDFLDQSCLGCFGALKRRMNRSLRLRFITRPTKSTRRSCGLPRQIVRRWQSL